MQQGGYLMKKFMMAALVVLLLVQFIPVARPACALSKADFAPKRRALCEIFVEPN
jgi:hypothetical protein